MPLAKGLGIKLRRNVSVVKVLICTGGLDSCMHSYDFPGPSFTQKLGEIFEASHAIPLLRQRQTADIRQFLPPFLAHPHKVRQEEKRLAMECCTEKVPDKRVAMQYVRWLFTGHMDKIVILQCSCDIALHHQLQMPSLSTV